MTKELKTTYHPQKTGRLPVAPVAWGRIILFVLDMKSAFCFQVHVKKIGADTTMGIYKPIVKNGSASVVFFTGKKIYYFKYSFICDCFAFTVLRKR